MAHAATPEFSDRYRSASVRAGVTIVLLALSGAIAALSAVHQVSEYDLLDRMAAGTLTLADANRFDAETGLIAIGQFLALVATGVAFLAWLSRSVDNVPALGGGRPIVTPRWAIGWWFVPLANLFMPFRAVLDLNRRIGLEPGGGGLILAWWIGWVLNNALGGAALFLGTPATLDDFRSAIGVLLTGDLATIAAAILAGLMVRSVQARAEVRAAAPPGSLPGEDHWQGIPGP